MRSKVSAVGQGGEEEAAIFAGFASGAVGEDTADMVEFCVEVVVIYRGAQSPYKKDLSESFEGRG